MTSGTVRPASPLVFLRTWLLPVALVGGAFGLHWALHVPPGPLPPPSPAKIEADKKAADKKKKDEEKKKRDEERKSGKVRPKPERPTVRELAYEPFGRPRPPHIIEQLWAYYEPKPFKSEPTFEAWQTAHKPLIAQIVSAARNTALPAIAAVNVLTSECHTIRCRFTLSGPEQAPLEQLAEVIKELEQGDGPLWHSITVTPAVLEPSKREGGPTRHKLDITASFMRDLPALDSIIVPGKGPLHLPAPPTPPPLPAGQDPLATPSSTGPRGSSTAPPTGATVPRRSSTATPSPTGATAQDPKPG